MPPNEIENVSKNAGKRYWLSGGVGQFLLSAGRGWIVCRFRFDLTVRPLSENQWMQAVLTCGKIV